MSFLSFVPSGFLQVYTHHIDITSFSHCNYLFYSNFFAPTPICPILYFCSKIFSSLFSYKKDVCYTSRHVIKSWVLLLLLCRPHFSHPSCHPPTSFPFPFHALKILVTNLFHHQFTHENKMQEEMLFFVQFPLQNTLPWTSQAGFHFLQENMSSRWAIKLLH